MKTWKKILELKWFKRLYVLYIFGCIFNFRPSVPFFYDFLTNNANYNENEIINEISPIYFYSVAVFLLPVMCLMEFLRYTPFIIASVTFGIIATCLYIWTSSLLALQLAQGVYGLMVATEFAYYVTVYSHGDAKTFQKLTSYIKAASLVGSVLASALAQLAVSLEWLSFKDLHYLNFGAFIVAAGITIFLPPAPKNEIEKSEKKAEPDSTIGPTILFYLSRAFPNKYVVKWTLWSILTFCGYTNFKSNLQPLWHEVQNDYPQDTFIYNGALECIYAFFALIAAILAGYANLDWKFKGDLILSMASLVVAFMLIFMSQLTSTLLRCACYIFLGFVHHLVVTVLIGEIAKFLSKGYFGFVFGFIAFGSWLLSSGMTIFVAANFEGLFVNNFQNLFMFYGFYFLFISILYIVIGLSYWFAKHTYE